MADSAPTPLGGSEPAKGKLFGPYVTPPQSGRSLGAEPVSGVPPAKGPADPLGLIKG